MVEYSTRKSVTGKMLHASLWAPNAETPVSGLLYMSHGFAEHLQWYEEIAVHLNKLGVIVYGHDHVGHGRSEGVRGHVDSVDHYVDDVVAHICEMKDKYPGIPSYLLGHSMGGFISILTSIHHPEIIDGLILVGSLVSTKSNEEVTTFKLFLAKILGAVLPYVTIAKLDLTLITKDQESLGQLEQDPLRYHGGMRAGWGLALMKKLQDLDEFLPQLKTPLFVAHGDEDKLCDPKCSQHFFEKVGSTDKKIKFYPGGYHNLFIEVPEVKNEVFEDVTSWMETRLLTTK